MPGTVLRSQAQQFVINLREYFERERTHGGPLVPFSSVQERVADALKISRKTVYNIKIKNDNKLIPSTPGKRRPRLKKKTTDLPDGQKMAVRNTLYDMYKESHNTSGLYEIQPNRNKNSFMVLCDMKIKGGGWTHIHKRFDGSVDFNLRWREYKFGFGDLTGEFWIGLENMHSLTDVNRNELLVELVDRDNGYAFAQYEEFRIGSEPDGYPLERLSGYTGDAGDSLRWHLGMKFTTKDVDQDLYDDHSCAEFSSGAYWYNNCFASNLNGELINHEVLPARERQGMIWDSFRNRSYVLGKARMLVRPFASR